MISVPRFLKYAATLGFIGLSFFAGHHAGYDAGYVYRDHELANNTHTYWDVIVLERYSDKRFKIQPAMATSGVWDTCLPQDWKSGQKMDWVTVEQRLGCKVIRYQHFYSDNKGERINASLQTR